MDVLIAELQAMEANPELTQEILQRLNQPPVLMICFDVLASPPEYGIDPKYLWWCAKQIERMCLMIYSERLEIEEAIALRIIQLLVNPTPAVIESVDVLVGSLDLFIRKLSSEPTPLIQAALQCIAAPDPSQVVYGFRLMKSVLQYILHDAARYATVLGPYFQVFVHYFTLENILNPAMGIVPIIAQSFGLCDKNMFILATDIPGIECMMTLLNFMASLTAPIEDDQIRANVDSACKIICDIMQFRWDMLWDTPDGWSGVLSRRGITPDGLFRMLCAAAANAMRYFPTDIHRHIAYWLMYGCAIYGKKLCLTENPGLIGVEYLTMLYGSFHLTPQLREDFEANPEVFYQTVYMCSNCDDVMMIGHSQLRQLLHNRNTNKAVIDWMMSLPPSEVTVRMTMCACEHILPVMEYMQFFSPTELVALVDHVQKVENDGDPVLNMSNLCLQVSALLLRGQKGVEQAVSMVYERNFLQTGIVEDFNKVFFTIGCTVLNTATSVDPTISFAGPDVVQYICQNACQCLSDKATAFIGAVSTQPQFAHMRDAMLQCMMENALNAESDRAMDDSPRPPDEHVKKHYSAIDRLLSPIDPSERVPAEKVARLAAFFNAFMSTEICDRFPGLDFFRETCDNYAMEQPWEMIGVCWHWICNGVDESYIEDIIGSIFYCFFRNAPLMEIWEGRIGFLSQLLGWISIEFDWKVLFYATEILVMYLQQKWVAGDALEAILRVAIALLESEYTDITVLGFNIFASACIFYDELNPMIYPSLYPKWYTILDSAVRGDEDDNFITRKQDYFLHALLIGKLQQTNPSQELAKIGEAFQQVDLSSDDILLDDVLPDDCISPALLERGRLTGVQLI